MARFKEWLFLLVAMCVLVGGLAVSYLLVRRPPPEG